MKEKFRNVGLWVSIFAFVGLILGNYGLYALIGMTSITFKILTDAFLGILTLAGVLSNPNSGTGFIDKK